MSAPMQTPPGTDQVRIPTQVDGGRLAEWVSAIQQNYDHLAAQTQRKELTEREIGELIALAEEQRKLIGRTHEEIKRQIEVLTLLAENIGDVVSQLGEAAEEQATELDTVDGFGSLRWPDDVDRVIAVKLSSEQFDMHADDVAQMLEPLRRVEVLARALEDVQRFQSAVQKAVVLWNQVQTTSFASHEEWQNFIEERDAARDLFDTAATSLRAVLHGGTGPAAPPWNVPVVSAWAAAQAEALRYAAIWVHQHYQVTVDWAEILKARFVHGEVTKSRVRPRRV
ncbi:hypothetical protein [Lentzea sp. E54]|uniref:hypothetical protein n=1 Tax=Lentzea xerophila TaxID=3435883 RepID=UPI003DA3D55E